MPGQIPDDDFVPLIDEEKNTVKLIRLEEYLKDYNPENHVRIYNLPGRIVKKGEAEKKDKQKKK
jgi:hypothetical protein